MGTIIGSGIFLVPQEMMRDVGSSWLVYLAWIVGGLLSLFGAMTYAELGAMMPEAGGEYVYLRGAYGDMAAFLYMWTWFAVAKPASIASVTTGLGAHSRHFSSASWLDGFALHGPLTLTWAQVFAIAVTWLMTGLNYLGMRKAGDFQLVFTWLKGVLILVIAGFCFASSRGSLAKLPHQLPGAHGGFGGFMVALIAALWAYDGWNDLTMVAGEVRRPRAKPAYCADRRPLHCGRAVYGHQCGHSVHPAGGADRWVAAPGGGGTPAYRRQRGAGLVSAAMALSIFVTLNGTVMSGARIPFAAARDRLFFSQWHTSIRAFKVPSTSLVVQGLLATRAVAR